MMESALRAIFVNFAHPETPHIAGRRLPTFAKVLAERGQRILLVTAALPGELGSNPCRLIDQLQRHDWSTPLHVEVPVSEEGDALPLLRPLHQLRSAVRLLGNGHLPAWPRAASRFLPLIATEFRPDVVWAVFGSVSDLVIGQRLASLAGCPWAIDFKDNFEKFIRPEVRPLVAWRFKDAALATCNARLHGEIAFRSFPHLNPHLIYSGVAPEMIAAPDVAVDTGRFVVSMIGSVYGRENMGSFCDGFATWLQSLPKTDQADIQFFYAGGDHEIVAKACASLSCDRVIKPYMSIAALGRITQRAAVNAYVWSQYTFHHKFMELLASRRPVIAFGGEHAETVNLAAAVGGDLRICASASALSQVLDSSFRAWRVNELTASDVNVEALTWNRFGGALEQALSRAAGVAASPLD